MEIKLNFNPGGPTNILHNPWDSTKSVQLSYHIWRWRLVLRPISVGTWHAIIKTEHCIAGCQKSKHHLIQYTQYQYKKFGNRTVQQFLKKKRFCRTEKWENILEYNRNGNSRVSENFHIAFSTDLNSWKKRYLTPTYPVRRPHRPSDHNGNSRDLNIYMSREPYGRSFVVELM